jgi:hypothetical protein
VWVSKVACANLYWKLVPQHVQVGSISFETFSGDSPEIENLVPRRLRVSQVRALQLLCHRGLIKLAPTYLYLPQRVQVSSNSFTTSSGDSPEHGTTVFIQTTRCTRQGFRYTPKFRCKHVLSGATVAPSLIFCANTYSLNQVPSITANTWTEESKQSSEHKCCFPPIFSANT